MSSVAATTAAASGTSTSTRATSITPLRARSASSIPRSPVSAWVSARTSVGIDISRGPSNRSKLPSRVPVLHHLGQNRADCVEPGVVVVGELANDSSRRAVGAGVATSVDLGAGCATACLVDRRSGE